MPLPQPLVQASVVDIQTDRPQPGDRFLVDTNVWYWLTYTRSANTARPPQNYQVNQYPKYIRSALNAQSQIFWSALSMAELTTLIERTEYELFCKTSGLDPKNLSPKVYRHNHPQERSNQVIPEIKATWGQVESLGNCLESNISQATITQIIANFSQQALDGYDSLIVSAAKAANMNQILTDDIDFITVPEVIVFTANRKAIQAAAAQGKLLVR